MSLGLSEAQIAVGLGAMRAVAAADGKDDALERALIEAAARALGGPLDPAPVGPDEAARAFSEPAAGRKLLQALVGMALIDGEPSPTEVECIGRYAAALKVDEPYVKNFQRLVEGQYTRLRVDFVRRMPIPRNLVGQLWEEQGIKGLWKLYRTVSQKGIDDPQLAWRYKKLGLLPRGTLGRAWWEFMTERSFAMPGEPGGLLEQQCHHDLTHVLTGYSTEPEGECQIAAFYSGYYKEDPFGFLFMVLVMFQVGFKLIPSDIVTAAHRALNPEKVLAAMQRGSKVSRDLTDHWDFWEDLPLPLEEVRRKYNIV
jgi:hypothetical protein